MTVEYDHGKRLREMERNAWFQAARNLPHDTDEYKASMLARAERFRRKAEEWESVHRQAGEVAHGG